MFLKVSTIWSLLEWYLLAKKEIAAFLYILYNRYWAISEEIKMLLLVPKYYPLFSNSSKTPGRRGLISDLSTFCNILHCHRLPQSCIYNYSHSPIQLFSLFHLLISSLGGLTPALTCWKRHKIFTSLIVLTCKPVFPLVEEL